MTDYRTKTGVWVFLVAPDSDAMKAYVPETGDSRKPIGLLSDAGNYIDADTAILACWELQPRGDGIQAKPRMVDRTDWLAEAIATELNEMDDEAFDRYGDAYGATADALGIDWNEITDHRDYEARNACDYARTERLTKAELV